MAVAVLQGKIAIGFIIGYAVGELYCIFMKYGLGASADWVCIVEAELKNLPRVTTFEKPEDVWIVWELFKSNGNTLALTSSQIELIGKLFPHDDNEAMSDFETGEAWVTHVYCIDTNEEYKVEKGKGGEGGEF